MEPVALPDWKPGSFELAVSHVRTIRRWAAALPAALALQNLLLTAVTFRRRLGLPPELSCPAPSIDPDGSYRLTLSYAAPVIQRRTQRGEWVEVDCACAVAESAAGRSPGTTE